MSLLLDALKKAAEQKAKKNKQETPEAPAVDRAVDEDGLEALLERAGDSTQTDVGRPDMPLDDGDLSMHQGKSDATDVRDPEGLARMAFGDDTDIRSPDEFAETMIEDHIEFANTGEFAETMLDEERSEYTDTGQFAETMIEDRTESSDPAQFAETMLDEERSEFADTGQFAETMIEDRTESSDPSQFAETMLDPDRSEFTDTGQFAETMIEDRTESSDPSQFAETMLDPDRSEFTDTGQFDETMVEEDRTEFNETGQFDETMVEEDRTEFNETGQFDETMVEEDRTELNETGQFGETMVEEDRTELNETGQFDETMVEEDRTEFNETMVEDAADLGETTEFVDPATGQSVEFDETRVEDRTEVGEPTEFGETMAEDRTETREPTEFVDTVSEDATDLHDRTETREPTEFTQTPVGQGDDDGVTGAEAVTADTTEYTVHFEEDQYALPDDDDDDDDEDRTEFREHGLADVTGFEASHGAEDDTGITRPREPEDQTDTSLPMSTLADLERRDSDDTTGVSDQDMSLLLVEDPTGATRRSMTDPRGRDAALRALQDDRQDGLSLVDTTRHQVPVDRARNLDSGSTTTTSMDTQTQGADGTTRRGDAAFTAASTTTYAPDNYDRTLMRMPSEDESKLFAGMKPEGDVVMTPDYAKKVFRSKSTAQRWQHIRTYAAIAIVILIGIGFYGAFEYQGQSENIDTSLRPLKFDPMPGLIKPETSQNLASLFADPEATERTIEIIESADRPDSGEIANENAEAVASEPDVAEAEPETAADDPVGAESGDAPPAGTNETTPTQVATVDASTGGGGSAAQPTTDTTNSDGSTLQITTNSRVAERDVWLRQAYQAYQSGDDDEAIRLYSQVLAEDPGNRNALLGRAAINVQNNRSRQAMQDYGRLLEANPKDSLAMTSMLAVSSLSPNDTETQLKLMIRDEPDSPYLNFALANAYGAQQRWHEAQGHYFIALQNNPQDPNYAYNLAVSLEHISQPQAAVAYYRRALDNFDKGLATFSRELVNQRMEVLENL